MQTFTIRTHTTNIILFEGVFSSMKQCLENAIGDGVSLANADLRKLSLAHATLDGANLRGADLRDCDLADANLSESDLTGVRASGANFDATCLCESRLIDINFRDTHFSNTLITGAVIDGCTFSCPSTLNLPFSQAQLGRNFFIQGGQYLSFASAPVVVTGLAQRLAFFDDAVLAGNDVFYRGLTEAQICLSSPLAGPVSGPVAKLVDAHDLKS